MRTHTKHFWMTIYLVLGFLPSWGKAKEFRAATGWVDVTPPPGMDLWGYGVNSRTTRVEVRAGEAIVNHALVTIHKMLGKLKDLPVQ